MADWSDILHTLIETDYLSKFNTLVTRAQASATTLETVSTSVATAVSSASAASASAAAALVSQGAAAASALSAASVVSQDLSVIDKTFLTTTTLVDVCLYDTSKDSDGGAWRKRCSHTSWENEALCGGWLGSAANEAAARAISGATTGSYWYDTTDLVFYKLNAGSGKTQVYRGNLRQFPAVALITAESARVIIWDLTTAGCPMWMVFVDTGANGIIGWPSGSVRTQSAAIMINGVLVTGGPTAGGLVFTFPADTTKIMFNAAYSIPDRKIASRNAPDGAVAGGDYFQIVNFIINDIAIIVLPNAPIDVATGLPTPTIAVATEGGVSVIKSDGNVWDIVATANTSATAVAFTKDNLVMFKQEASNYGRSVRVHAIPTADVSFTNTTKSTSLEVYTDTTSTGIASDMDIRSAAVTGGLYLAGESIGNVVALNIMKRNPGTPSGGLVAFVTKDYNSGWLPGAIKGAWLADTVAETLTGAELVTNGTFASTTTGWTATSATLSVSSGELVITNNATAYGSAYQAITTVVGKTYIALFTSRKGTCSGSNLCVGTAAGGTQNGTLWVTSATNVTNQINFVATATTTYISVVNGDNTNGLLSYADNISCYLADVDRSVKAKGAQVFGSLTKAAVASGAQLMGYSGFSAANYIQQPYNSDLDFGTGDFCVMGWIKEAPNSTYECIFSRGYYSGAAWSGGGTLYCYVTPAGLITLEVSDDSRATADSITSGAAVDDSTWKFVCFLRRGAAIEQWINSVKSAADVTLSAAVASLSNTSATLEIGYAQSAAQPLTNGTLALWRIAAYAPTAEQIAHIYNTEKGMFEASAQCCLYGSSNAITALAYDDETDLLHVGTSAGRSVFKGLVRTAYEATAVGAIRALAAGGGVVAQAGATAADIYVPAYQLREELKRAAEQKRAFGQALVPVDFTATASQTIFTLPVGYEIVAVYQQGAIKRETTSWTRSFDGFKWSAVLVSGATVSDWICVMVKRTS